MIQDASLQNKKLLISTRNFSIILLKMRPVHQTLSKSFDNINGMSLEELDPHQLSQENGSDPQQIDWNPFYLDFDGLNRRLQQVKREFGMRKAISTQSLTGETRTLAEILDKEIEKIVLFFFRIGINKINKKEFS
jgi:hypothetical protein